MTQQQSPISLPYKLPSFGRLYDGKIPNGEVTIFPIRGEQEELLAGTADQTGNSLTVLQHITQQLIQLPPEFAFQELLVTDWMACLLNLLSFSYSSVVTLKPKCPACNHGFIQQTDMKKLECKYASDLEDVEKYKEPFEAKPLPKSGDRVKFKLLRLRDMNRIQEYVQRTKSKRGVIGGDPSVTYTLAMQIFSINDNGNMSDIELLRWVRNALAFDLRFLREQMEVWDTGYDLKPSFSCPRCEEVFEVQLPLDFFRQVSAKS